MCSFGTPPQGCSSTSTPEQKAIVVYIYYVSEADHDSLHVSDAECYDSDSSFTSDSEVNDVSLVICNESFFFFIIIMYVTLTL